MMPDADMCGKEQQQQSERKKDSNSNGDSPMHMHVGLNWKSDPRVTQKTPSSGLSDICNLRVKDLLLLRGRLLQLLIELRLQSLPLASLRPLCRDRLLQRRVTRLHRRDQILLLDWAGSKSQKHGGSASMERGEWIRLGSGSASGSVTIGSACAPFSSCWPC